MEEKTFVWHAVEELEITTYATVHLTGNFNQLYDIASKHSMDLDHVKTLMEDAFIARFPTVPVQCKMLLYDLQASIDITEKEQKGWMKDFIVNNDLVNEL